MVINDLINIIDPKRDNDMTNKEKAFLIVEIIDLLDRWDKFREENKEDFKTDGAVTQQIW